MLLNRFIVRNNKYNVHKKTISVVQNGFHAASQNPSIFQKSGVLGSCCCCCFFNEIENHFVLPLWLWNHEMPGFWLRENFLMALKLPRPSSGPFHCTWDQCAWVPPAGSSACVHIEHLCSVRFKGVWACIREPQLAPKSSDPFWSSEA